MTSRIPGFYRLTPEERLNALKAKQALRRELKDSLKDH